MGITLSHKTPQQVFGIQFSIWFVTVLPFMIADFVLYHEDLIFSSCFYRGTNPENIIALWFQVDAFTKTAILGEIILFGIIMLVLRLGHFKDSALVQKTVSIILFVFFLFELAWTINAIVLLATVLNE